MSLFITIRFLDIVDILLVALLLYQLYMWIKGTIAFNIFMGVFIIYLFWLLVKALNMELIGTVLGQFIGIGVLALIIVFQQEIRRFLILIGSKYRFSRAFRLEKIFGSERESVLAEGIKEITRACDNMSKSKTGALIVIPQRSEINEIIRTGENMNAKISEALIETVFFKNSPLHDGAMIIIGDKITAARCILPNTDRTDFTTKLGLRHRAAIGITESTDALAVVVSEESGKISIAREGQLQKNITLITLTKELERIFGQEEQ